MTLVIKVLKVSGKLSNGDLFMSGSQAGTFKICGSYLENDQKRIAVFSVTDCILFSLCEKGQGNQSKEGKAFTSHSCELMKQFIENNHPEHEDIAIKYDIQLYTREDEPFAKVHMSVSYKKGLLFQGMVPAFIQAKLKFVSFFKGAQSGKTKNLFNVLDGCTQPQQNRLQFKPLQTVYKDRFV